MNSYSFSQNCRPRGDFRIDEILEYFDLMKEAFRCPEIYGSNSKALELSRENLERIFRKKIDKLFPGIGVDVDWFTIPPRNRDDNTVRFEIHTGAHPEKIFIDTYDISIGEAKKVPDLSYFEKSIQIFEPFEAYLSEFKNEAHWDWYDRQQEIENFDRPAIIRGFHYMDESLIRNIGGMKHCLKAPAWKVERFCKGVLIELVPGLFDHENPEHLKIQEEAMEHFGIPVVWTAPEIDY